MTDEQINFYSAVIAFTFGFMVGISLIPAAF